MCYQSAPRTSVSVYDDIKHLPHEHGAHVLLRSLLSRSGHSRTR